MRRPLVVSLIALVVVLVAGLAALFVQYRKTSDEYVRTKAAEETARTSYAQTIEAIAEIQDSLNAISIGDPAAIGSDAEQNLSGARGREALDRIGVLRASILRSKERIRTLEDRLHHSGTRVAGLQRMISRMKKDVAEKEGLIAHLTANVDSLQTQVSGLVTEVQQNQETLREREQTIEDKRRELATIFYVVGNRKQLTESGVVVPTGGVLGLGKTLQPTGSTNVAGFTPLDTDQDTVIRVPGEKVRVLSAQPSASYQLRVVEGQGVTELHIVDPTEFRKIKQLVILSA